MSGVNLVTNESLGYSGLSLFGTTIEIDDQKICGRQRKTTIGRHLRVIFKYVHDLYLVSSIIVNQMKDSANSSIVKKGNLKYTCRKTWNKIEIWGKWTKRMSSEPRWQTRAIFPSSTTLFSTSPWEISSWESWNAMTSVMKSQKVRMF